MKVKLFAIILLTTIIFASVDQKPKQFETKFIITYNSITLEKAGELEKKIKELFKDACSVDVQINNVQTTTLTGSHIIRSDTVNAGRYILTY